MGYNSSNLDDGERIGGDHVQHRARADLPTSRLVVTRTTHAWSQEPIFDRAKRARAIAS